MLEWITTTSSDLVHNEWAKPAIIRFGGAFERWVFGA
jgi:hypothetical protein